jgi:hypothetical protein
MSECYRKWTTFPTHSIRNAENYVGGPRIGWHAGALSCRFNMLSLIEGSTLIVLAAGNAQGGASCSIQHAKWDRTGTPSGDRPYST